MLVLNNSNESVDLNLIPDEVDMNFCVFSNESPTNADYFFPQLIMLESFYAPTLRLRIGHFYVNVPSDFQILIGEPTHGDLEVNPVTSLSGRNFNAFVLNPLTSFTASYLPIDIDDVLPTTKWFLPKMKTGDLLAVPLKTGIAPPCIYIVRDIPKSMEVVKISCAF